MQNQAGLKFVCIGGGTGLSTLLSGLKHFVAADAPSQEMPSIDTLTAVVTVTDDGGSSGRLREEFQMLPPGDIRNCMVALAEDELLMTRLFQHRFESEGDLSGHSFGNLFLAALVSVTGDFVEAIKVTSEVLAIKGRIYPSTIEDVTLVAELKGGSVVHGETNIVESRKPINRLWLSTPECQPLPETIEAIKNADVITVGPGSLYTSIIPNLLVDGIVDAIKTSPAHKVYICNLMTQPGETEGFSFQDHIEALNQYSSGLAYDTIVANSAPIHGELAERYRRDGAVPVYLQSVARNKWNDDGEGPYSIGEGPYSIEEALTRAKVIAADLLAKNEVVRHDPSKLARLLMEVCASGRQAH